MTELNNTDQKAPIFIKIINNHPSFTELKSLVDATESSRVKKSKKWDGCTWTGFCEDDEYLTYVSKNNKIGNKIAEIQYKILSETGFLKQPADGRMTIEQCFQAWRTYPIDWDKVRDL